MKPHSISHIAVCLTPEVGANDALVGVQVVPMGYQGTTILGRTLMDGEQDSGEPIRFYPYDGKPASLRSNFQRGVKRLPVRGWRKGGSR